MKKTADIRSLLLAIACLLSMNAATAQAIKIANPDSLFLVAQGAAFNNQWELSRTLNYQILNDYPNYLDAKVLIGRTLAWEGKYEPARKLMVEVLQEKKKYYDALDASIDIEIWDETYIEALNKCQQALSFYPNDENFLAKKAAIEIHLGQNAQAKRDILAVLDINPSNAKVRELMQKLKNANILNKISLDYTYEYFDEPWTRRWNLFSLSYTRKTKYGPVIARVYVGDVVMDQEKLFEKETGIQYELEAYPKLSKNNYAFVAYAYSDKMVFPRHRAALEFYQKLPASFEVSLGARYMQFILDSGGTQDLMVYTGSLGYYFHNYWVAFRPYLSPKNSDVDQSYYLEFRSYFKSKDNFLSAIVGTGSTPDDPSNDVGNFELYKLNKYRIRLSYQQLIFERLIVEGNVAYQNEEFKKGEYRDVYTIGIKTHFFF